VDAGGAGGVCTCAGASDCAALGEVCQQAEHSLESPPVAYCMSSCLADGGTYCGNSFRFVFPLNYCNPTSGTCGPCAQDSQCSGNYFGLACLDAGFCGCLGDPDCGPDEVCDPTAEQCVTTCNDTLAGGCQNGQVCNSVTGLCGP
jgi:hypothetical protein